MSDADELGRVRDLYRESEARHARTRAELRAVEDFASGLARKVTNHLDVLQMLIAALSLDDQPRREAIEGAHHYLRAHGRDGSRAFESNSHQADLAVLLAPPPPGQLAPADLAALERACKGAPCALCNDPTQCDDCSPAEKRAAGIGGE